MTTQPAPIHDDQTRISELTELISAWATKKKILQPDEVLEVHVSIKKPKKVVVSLEGYRGLQDIDLVNINDLGLSVRANNVLSNSNISTVGDLRKKSFDEILKFRNMGRKSLREIYDNLKGRGVDLGWPESRLGS
jgi:DNA-directed RNA polymerase subunit alpha